jgi:hypothetical protein
LDSASAEGVGDSARRSSASQSALVARACSGTNAGARIRKRAKKSSCVYLFDARAAPVCRQCVVLRVPNIQSGPTDPAAR